MTESYAEANPQSPYRRKSAQQYHRRRRARKASLSSEVNRNQTGNQDEIHRRIPWGSPLMKTSIFHFSLERLATAIAPTQTR